jgi:hypothetical protein
VGHHDVRRDPAEEAEQQLSEMMPLHQVGELLRWGIVLGVGIAQVCYDRGGESWTPTFRVWHPRFLRWDWVRRCYTLQTADAGEIPIEPSDPAWIIYEPYGPLGWLRGALRALAMPCLIRAWTRSWWARHQESHGTPVRLGIVPDNRDPADEKLFLSQVPGWLHASVKRTCFSTWRRR